MVAILKSKFFITIVITVIVLILSISINYKLSPLALVAATNVQFYFNYVEGKVKKKSIFFLLLFNGIFIISIILIANYTG